jgi:hypothetical protein
MWNFVVYEVHVLLLDDIDELDTWLGREGVEHVNHN